MNKINPKITGAYLNADTQKAALKASESLPLDSELKAKQPELNSEEITPIQTN